MSHERTHAHGPAVPLSTASLLVQVRIERDGGLLRLPALDVVVSEKTLDVFRELCKTLATITDVKSVELWHGVKRLHVFAPKRQQALAAFLQREGYSQLAERLRNSDDGFAEEMARLLHWQQS